MTRRILMCLFAPIIWMGCRENVVEPAYEVVVGRKIVAGHVLSISPNATKILFADNSWNLFMCDSGGSDIMQLTHESNINIGSACWSPNGQEVVFIKILPAYGINPSFYFKVMSINVNSKALREISTNDSSVYPHNTVERLMWSPSGDMIAYYEDSPPTSVVKITKSDGSGIVLEKSVSREFSWAPSGNQFVCTYGYPDSGNIYRGDAGSGILTKVVSLDHYFSLSWLSDSSSIDYVDLSGDLVRFNMMLRNKKTLLQAPEAYQSKESPDGNKIAYIVQNSGNADSSPRVKLYCTGTASALVALNQTEIYYVWSPDSKDIYYEYDGYIYKTDIP